MSKICPTSMAECYRSCGDAACRASGWEDPLTGKMPADYKVPPEPPMTTHDHNPPPVRPPVRKPEPDKAFFTGEGMRSAMEDIWAKTKAQSPPIPGPADFELYGKPAYQQAAEAIDRANQSNPKHALGLSKVPLHFAPMSSVVLMALVFEVGAKKYGQLNWRDTPVVRSVYLDALGRHYMALLDGQDLDEETGYPQEAHIMACAAILIDAKELGRLIDDRGTPGNVAEILKSYTVPAGLSRGYPHDGAR